MTAKVEITGTLGYPPNNVWIYPAGTVFDDIRPLDTVSAGTDYEFQWSGGYSIANCGQISYAEAKSNALGHPTNTTWFSVTIRIDDVRSVAVLSYTFGPPAEFLPANLGPVNVDANDYFTGTVQFIYVP